VSAEAIRNDLDRLSQTIEHLRQSQRESSSEWFKSVGQAQLLSQYYTGLESSFEKALKLTGIDVPSNSNHYHKEILVLALQHQLVPHGELEYLSDLLSFRHFVRHAYGVEFRPEEVDQKISLSLEKWPLIRQAMEVKLGIE
jgi:NADH:ubiquinone oxidoreductase subunit C